MEKCNKCNNTGIIETGNNDLPCDCEFGDKAMFNRAGITGPITGAEIKKHFLNNSPEPISIHGEKYASELPRRNIEQNKFSDKLNFSDLKVGDLFIVFPAPGDNNGHGGFKNKHHIFKKIIPILKENHHLWHEDLKYNNAKRLNDGCITYFVPNIEVINIG